MSRNPITTIITVILWGLGIAAGLLYSIQYEATPTPMAIVPTQWPSGTSCPLSSERPTLIMFVHPRCPCSRASLDELAKLMERCLDRVSTHVIFFQSSEPLTAWANSKLWDQASRIPGVVPRLDVDGVEHRLFAASISGEVFLYRPNGDLVFHGGITAGRGHAGDNRGRLTIESFLLNHDLPVKTNAVYGCKLESCRRCSTPSATEKKPGSTP